tara:strand:+ start:337 stop:651 length:315 start_codon:yes stop_codon:yes gene_type:complete
MKNREGTGMTRVKKTALELTGIVEDMAQQIEHLHRGLQVVLAELNLVSTLLLHDLLERGKLRQVDCVNCGQMNNVPLVEGMQVDDPLICRFCNNDLETKVEEEE